MLRRLTSSILDVLVVVPKADIVVLGRYLPLVYRSMVLFAVFLPIYCD